MRIQHFVPALFIFLGLSVSASDSADSYVGLRYPPRPKGVSFVEGYTLSHGYGVEAVLKGDQEIWWLGKLLSRDGQGRPNFEVVAAMLAPKLPVGYAYIRGMCTSDNPEDIKESIGHGGSQFIAAVNPLCQDSCRVI